MSGKESNFQGLRPTCADFIKCETEKYEDTTQKHLTKTMTDALKEGTVSDVNLDDKEPLPKYAKMSELLKAAEEANFHEVTRLIESGADANETILYQNLWRETALHIAVKSGSLEIAKYFVEHGADINCKNGCDETALHMAVRSGSLEIVKCLVEHGADINCKNGRDETALHMAARSGSLEMVKYLVEHGADCKTYDTILYYAVKSGSLDMVKYLVEHGTDINSNNFWEGTALHMALKSGSLEMVKYLAEHGADINSNNFWEGTALHIAAKSGSLEMVKYLVKHGADINCDNFRGGTALHIAVRSGSLEIVKYLVQHVADINCENFRRETALHMAVRSGALEMVRYLVEHRAGINRNNHRDRTVLHVAVRSGSLEMVKYLVEHDAKVTREDCRGWNTVLYLACASENGLIVDYLLQNGAIEDLNKQANNSPLYVACYWGHTAVVQTLLKYKVDIRKERVLKCGNDEIINILKHELKKSIKHREKFDILKTMDEEKMIKVGQPLKDFSTLESFSLGKGSNGTSVYVGIMEDGSEVAVKRMLIQACEKSAQNEIEILSCTDTRKSPFIVSYRHFHRDDNFIYLILDLCEETLREHVYSQTAERLTKHGPRMVKEILTGLGFLHSQRILHRDLKPENVLVDVAGHMRLADFGISRVLNEDETTVQTDAKGTRDWMPVEVIEAINNVPLCGFKRKSDIQVAGMLAFFVLTKGEHPFGASHQRMTNILEGNPVNLGNLDNLQAREFVAWLVRHIIHERPYAHEALTDSFMAQVKDHEASPHLRKRSSSGGTN